MKFHPTVFNRSVAFCGCGHPAFKLVFDHKYPPHRLFLECLKCEDRILLTDAIDEHTKTKKG